MAGKRLTQAQRKEKTRSALLSAGAEVFIKHGYRGASIDIIAEKAGYTKGAVYAHFKNKEDLFFAVFSARAAVQFQILKENINDPDLLKKATDTKLQKKAGGFRHDNKQWIRLVLEYLLYAQRRPKANKRLQTFFADNRALIGQVLKERYGKEHKLTQEQANLLAQKQQIIDLGFSVMYLIDDTLSLDVYRSLMAAAIK